MEESKSNSINYGVGLNYKYAINVDKFFIAPGIIIEQNRSKNDLNSSENFTDEGHELKINNRYGVKADIGYDVTENFAPYFVVGYSSVGYRSTTTGLNSSGITNGSRSGRANDWFYGVGTKFDLGCNLALNLEYNTQNFSAKTSVDTVGDVISRYKTRLDILKLGVSYKF